MSPEGLQLTLKIKNNNKSVNQLHNGRKYYKVLGASVIIVPGQTSILSIVPQHMRSCFRYVNITETGPTVPLTMSAENISLPLRNVLNSIRLVRDGVLGK